MAMNNVLSNVALALVASLLIGAFAPQVAEAQQGQLRPAVGTPLQEALELGNKGQYPQALAKVKAAEAATNKTAFEQFQINETYGFVYLKQRNYAAAAAAYERSLNSGQLPAGKVQERVKQLAQLHFQNPRNLDKVIEYGNRYLKESGGRDPAMHAMVGQAYQLKGNDKAAVAAVEAALRTAQAAGQRANENWLRILLKSYSNLGDTAGVNRTTLNLVQLYPTKDNWRLLSGTLRRQAAGDDRVAMNVYRLMNELELMDRPDIVQEAAIAAIQSSLPAEAVTLLEQGYTTKVLPADDARSKRILTDAQNRKAAQQPNLARLKESAGQSDAGQNEILVGELLLSYGMIDDALAAAKRAAQKGAKPDDVHMLRGRALVANKNGAEARKAFSQVKGEDTALVARLWGIYASRL